jgi:hypothetical protein
MTILKHRTFRRRRSNLFAPTVASIHLYGTPNQHRGEKNVAVGWGWAGGPGVCGGGSCPADRLDTGPSGDVAGKSTPQKPG